MTNKKTALARVILSLVGLIIGGLLIFDGILLITISGFDTSKVFSGGVGIALIVFVIVENILLAKKQVLGRLLLGLFVVFLISFVIVEGLLISGANLNTMEGDVIIVLGAGLTHDQPGPLLRRRLDKALEFLAANEQAVCVVSGGQGPDEVDSEAAVMANYLRSQGLADERIILEDKSTRTLENFAFSKVILDEYFDYQPYKAVYVTNTFHVYRSGLIAKQVGFEVGGIRQPGIGSR